MARINPLNSPSLYPTDISPIPVPYISQNNNKAIAYKLNTTPTPSPTNPPTDPVTGEEIKVIEEKKFIGGGSQCGVSSLTMLINAFIVRKAGATSNKIISQATGIPKLYDDYDQQHLTTNVGNSIFKNMSAYNPIVRKEIFLRNLGMEIDQESFPRFTNRVPTPEAPVRYCCFVRNKIPETNVGSEAEMFTALKYHRSILICRTRMTTYGHFITLVGYNKAKDSFIANDPYGEYDFKAEKHNTKKSGRNVLYKADDMLAIMRAWKNNNFLSYMFIADWAEFTINYAQDNP